MGFSPSEYLDYRNCHRGNKFIVCGCGQSLNELPTTEDAITIGVNDIGRLFQPDYLVVLNKRNQFSGDRFSYVESSRARALFTHLDLGIDHPHIVRFRLGRRGGTDLSDPDALPYTRNSPYVALCLAAFMGAKRIGLIGVDFTDHHFYANTGRHPLSSRLHQINAEYARLGKALRDREIEVFNLSSSSRLTAFPHRAPEAFLRPEQSTPVGNVNSEPRRSSMRVYVQRRGRGIVGDFLEAIAESASSSGCVVTREAVSVQRDPGLVSVVWNGRSFRSKGPVLYCEHGWLPRWGYQLSYQGINADSHAAPFIWDGRTLSNEVRVAVHDHLEQLKAVPGTSHEYMRTDATAVDDLPGAYLLVALQIEKDTNIVRHVPERFRRMQALIDHVSEANPPLPVVFKQHPADAKRHNAHLKLQVRRPQDVIRPHHQGNIHQLLKSGRCRGVIALNSNVVHDALLWDVPAIALGRNIWPREGISPFLRELPADWEKLWSHMRQEQVRQCTEAYIHHLMQHQWSLDDARDPQRVARLLDAHPRVQAVAPVRPTRASKQAGRQLTRINVVARNKGWLFEDLRQRYLRLDGAGVRLILTERPDIHSDAWIYIRAQEAISTPDPSRTLVQLHDQFDDGLYRAGGKRHIVHRCGALALTHPEQANILGRNGVPLDHKPHFVAPLGAARDFRLRKRLSRQFTLAWVGRPVQYRGEDIKRLAWFEQALLGLQSDLPDLRTVLLGERMGATANRMQETGLNVDYRKRSRHPHHCYPALFQEFDALVVTSSLAAGPNALFEALASGVPVISTRCGWASTYVRPRETGWLVDSPEEIAAAIRELATEREDWFQRRRQIRNAVAGISLEDWLQRSVTLLQEILGQTVEKERASAR